MIFCRRSSGREQCAGVGVNLRDHAIEGRGHASVRKNRFVFLQRRFGSEQSLLGGGQRVLRGRDSSAGLQVFSLGHVNFLLRDKFGPRFLNVREPLISHVRYVVRGFSPALFFSCARDVLVGTADGRFILEQLLL